jgi:D-alanyl-D-alanine carboxypeptidase (penicillin-binding protein 5/6)
MKAAPGQGKPKATNTGRAASGAGSGARQNVESRLNDHYSSICIEAQSGLVISEHNADAQRPPASMVKMMLMLLVTEGLRDGTWTLDRNITVTKHAQGMGGTQVFLKEGETFPLGDLMMAVSVHSANDAAMAVAEGLWGTEDAYKKRMNERAAELGMTRSAFTTVHGLPPAKGQQPDLTTARDMARLGQFCVLDPTIRTWVTTKEFRLRPADAIQTNTNLLLSQMPNCDGIKTGFTRAAGFCITATAMQDGIRLISVVMGIDGKQDRFRLARQLLEEGFAQICRKRVIAKGDPIGQPVSVANCETSEIQLTAGEEVSIIVKQADVDKLEIAPALPERVRAPLPAGASVGEVAVKLEGKTLGSAPLTVPSDLAEAGWRWKLTHSVPSR